MRKIRTKMKFSTFNFQLSIIAAAIMIFAASCGDTAPKPTTAEQSALPESEPATVTETPANNILPTLLRNRVKMTSLSNIVEYGGKVYNWDYFTGKVPSEWISVEQYKFAIAENTVIYTSSDGFEYPTELHCSDLKGKNVKVIHADISFPVWICGDKIVYAGKDQQTDEWNRLFCYDVKTSKSTFLCQTWTSRVVSCDNDYVYYITNAPGVVGRIRWNGTGEEHLEGITFPEDVYKVEDEQYYCVTTDYNWETDSGTTNVSGYSIESNQRKGNFTLDARQLITIKEGYAYYGNKTGIYKLNLFTDQTLRLSDIDPALSGTLSGAGFSVGYIYGDYLYFDALYEDGYDDIFLTSKLYKVPLNGGKMEYLNKQWTNGGD